MGNKHKNKGKKYSSNPVNNNKEMEENKINTPEENPDPVASEEASASSPEEKIEEQVESGVADACSDLEKKVKDLEEEVAKEKKDYLFLMAEFDNFRKRTLKEKSDIIKNAGENVLKGLLPIMDDFERGIKAAENSPEGESVKEGVKLIYNKLQKYLNQNGVKEMDPEDDTFDTEKHEAISVVPVADEDKKGKILDTVEKGYTINDKVLRHAKVVVGQ